MSVSVQRRLMPDPEPGREGAEAPVQEGGATALAKGKARAKAAAKGQPGRTASRRRLTPAATQRRGFGFLGRK
mgnify:CR=1 FL=1